MEFEKEVETIKDVQNAVFVTIDETIESMSKHQLASSSIYFEYRGHTIEVLIKNDLN